MNEVLLEREPGRAATPVVLGPVLGVRGSQGEVRAVVGAPELAVKIVNRADRAELAERLDLMLTRPPRKLSDPGRVCWPTGRALHPRDRSVVGYAMPRLSPTTALPLDTAFQRRFRTSILPGITWRWYVEVAANLALLVAEVNENGHVIGDLAPQNLFVSTGGRVSIVDTDGWQLAPGADRPVVLPCPFSREEYAPLEVLDSAPGDIRDQYSDWWALAVLIGQVLALGVHPYAGVVPGSQPPYDEVSNVRNRTCWLLGHPDPVLPWRPPASFLPESLRRMFQTAFVSGYGRPHLRPSPRQWHRALREAAAALLTCDRVVRHVHPAKAECAWCELAADGGADRFEVIA